VLAVLIEALGLTGTVGLAGAVGLVESVGLDEPSLAEGDGDAELGWATGAVLL
jgi:hypothetical protein